MTRVVHCKRAEYDIYIGRPSKWGNPFIIGRDGSRDIVVAKYEAWVLGRKDLIPEIRAELRGKVLGCWCNPGLSCHGQVLARIADQQ